MSKNCGNNKVGQKRVMKKLLNRLILSAFAEVEEPSVLDTPVETKDTPQTETPSIDFEKLIAQARKEEKDKLYPEIVKLKDSLKVMTDNNNANLLEVARLKEELEAYKNKGESEELTKTKEALEKVKKEFSDFKKATVSEEEIREKLTKEFEVKTYLSEQKIANKENILPMFLITVTGNTKEEIDEAINNAIELTNKAKEELGATNQKPNTPPNLAKVNNTPPVSNPSGHLSKSFDLEAIRNLDPRSPEYAEWRKSQGLK